MLLVQAIEFYTYATEMDPKNHIYMTNRALCYASMKKWDKSLRDADKAIALKPDWEKVRLAGAAGVRWHIARELAAQECEC